MGTLSVPVAVYMELCYLCNLHCFHCYSDSGFAGYRGRPTEKVVETLNQLHEAGVFYVNFGGGEPFVRKDILQILECASRYFEVGVVTNGTLVTETTADHISKLGVAVGVSIDGTEELHNSIRGPGTFQKATRTIRMLVNRGINTSMITCVSKLNLNSLDGVVGLAQSLGVSSLRVSRFVPMGRGSLSSGMALRPEEMHALAKRVLYHRQRLAETMSVEADADFYGLFSTLLPRSERLEPWGAAKSVCNITADGHITPDPSLRGPYMTDETVPESRFLDVWKGAEGLRATREFDASMIRECSSCQFVKSCQGGCRAASFAVEGDIYHPDPGCWYFNSNHLQGSPNSSRPSLSSASVKKQLLNDDRTTIDFDIGRFPHTA